MRSWPSWSDRAAALGAAALVLLAPARLAAQSGDMPPAGFGTLRQDQIAVRLSTDNLAVRALPLDERIIRMLSPDAYRSLHELALSRAADIALAARGAGHDSLVAFLVTFFGLQPQVRFNPDQVYVSSQNRLFRPVGILPLTPGWSEYQVDQRQQAVAIYLFEPGVDVLRPFQVSYGTVTADSWDSALRVIDAERARVRSRARPGQP